MGELRTLAEIVGLLLLVIAGLWLREFLYRGANCWNSTYEDDVRRAKREERKRRKAEKRQFRELNRKNKGKQVN